ncbi:MAG: aromatic amino acid lyase [Antricoccus sp.]
MIELASAIDLGLVQIRALAHSAEELTLSPALMAQIDRDRAVTMRALSSGSAVYGVNTGMGALAGLQLSETDQASHQGNLMLARSVGGAPWLRPEQVRAVVGARLRTLLAPEAGVSAKLCQALAAIIGTDSLPAIPARGCGAAGEIIPLAHLGGYLTGTGTMLQDGTAVAAGHHRYQFGPKEGIALLEGMPVITGLSILISEQARTIADLTTTFVGIGVAVVGGNRDPFTAVLARKDSILRSMFAQVSAAAGPEPKPRSLQLPLSFRVAAGVAATLHRCADLADERVEASFDRITDSPAFVGGHFVGTDGFYGYDLALALDSLRLALCHMGELSARRLHRLLDPAVTDLPRQLSARPGLHAGLVAVHKRAVSAVRELQMLAQPMTIGTIETSLGQEDVQTFGVDAAEQTDRAIGALCTILACEGLALHQAVLLGGRPPSMGPAGCALLDQLAQLLPVTSTDRPFGIDLENLRSWVQATTARA